MIEPLGVGHGCTRSEHADPGAMCGLGEVNRDSEFAGEHTEAGDVILVFVGDEDGVERCRIFARERHALTEFAAGEAGIDKDARP